MYKVIVVTKTRHKIVTRFKGSKKAKAFRDLVKKEKLEGVQLVCLVSDQPKYPEPGTEPERGKLWCVYCGRHRSFSRAYKGDDYKWCQVCGISDNDYHIKVVNRIDSGGKGLTTRNPYASPDPKVSDKLSVHRKIKCTECEDTKLQYINQEQRSKKKGTLLLFCPRCGLKSSVEAKLLHRFLGD